MTMTKELSKVKILVVDDSRTMRVEIISILKECGLTNVMEACDGDDAWKKIAAETAVNEPFDLIFSDINMPKMNGIKLLKKIKYVKAYELVPVIMVSTENEKGTVLEAIAEGATDYILKPFDKKTVTTKILKILSA